MRNAVAQMDKPTMTNTRTMVRDNAVQILEKKAPTAMQKSAVKSWFVLQAAAGDRNVVFVSDKGLPVRRRWEGAGKEAQMEGC
jgi:hypothetical protein